MSQNITFLRDSIGPLADKYQLLVAYVDTDQRYVFANAMYAKWFGMTPSEVVGQRLQNVLGEANYTTVHDKVEEALAGKKVSYSGEIPLGDGTTLPFQVDYLPHCDEQGKTQGYFILAHELGKSSKIEGKYIKYRFHLDDIIDARTTERVTRLTKVETEPTTADSIITAIEDGISIQDRDFKILYQNAVHKDIIGDHVGKFCYKAYQPNVNICPDCPVEKSFHDGKIHKAEKTVAQRPEATYEIISSPIKNDAGDILAVIEIIKDISERKKREQDLKKTNLELEQILNTVENGIVMIDKDKNILRVNRTMLTMEHLSKNEVIGRKCHDLCQVAACHTGLCPLQKILAGASIVRMEGERQHLDGSSFPCEMTAKPMLDTSGNLTGMVADVRDLTEKKKLQQETERLLKQTIHSDKLAALGTVVAGVAHEINNPNSFIAYNAPMAEKIWQGVKPVLDEYAANNPKWRVGNFSYQEIAESMAETLQFIKTGSERINGIVNSLKEFAGQDRDLDNAFIQVNDIITQAYTIIGAQLRKRVATVEINLADNLPELYGQFQRVEQVIVNLMLNAMNAIGDRKTGRISVTTKYNTRLQAILIIIEDNGKGIKKEDMDLIFDPFFTTRRDQGGSGMGLAVSCGLIREHNGTISVLSQPDQGTRFTVYLPLDKRQQKKVSISPIVLCINTEQPTLQLLLETFFKRATDDISISTLDNPEHILTYLEEHPEVDLVIFDVIIPQMDDGDILTKIKNKFPLVSTALYSDQSQPVVQPEGTFSPYHIISNPLSLEEITTIIKSIGRRTL